MAGKKKLIDWGFALTIATAALIIGVGKYVYERWIAPMLMQ